MSYVGNKPPFITIPADDSVTSAMIVDGTIVNTDVNASAGIANSKMATDTTNASNLASGTVPTARLGSGSASSSTFLTGAQTYAAVDTSGIISNRDDIALLGFKVAANGSLAKYNLVDQTVDDFQDTSGVDASASTNEIRDSSGKYYGSVVLGSYSTDSITATGAGTWTAPSDTTQAEILIVAGGGAGGGGGALPAPSGGGGGGAGGLVYNAAYTVVPAVVYDVTVGAGGSNPGDANAGANGADTVWNVNAEGSGATMTAVGGGGGGCQATPSAGIAGGSAGGNAGNNTGGGTSGTQGDSGGGTGFGNAGGNAWAVSYYSSGGGGGAGSAGVDGASNSGNGGSGKDYNSSFGNVGGNSNGTFAGGGGGGVNDDGSGGTGQAGGGNGGSDNQNGTAATANTGSGGGGGAGQYNGAAGGSGIVVIKHRPEAYNNMTLVSTTTAAQAAPTKGDIVLTYTNGAGTTTLDTDLTAEISADGGSTWTALALGSEGSTGSHNIATSHDVTISSTITSPWNMAYRIKTLNQAVGKTTRIQAVSLGWS